jgi:putative addiction module killer protein
MSPIGLELREYIDQQGRSRFAAWFDALEATAAAKVSASLLRLEQGNISNVESVGGGVFELKIHFGPGYRVYFGRDGTRLVILLGGGTKKRHSRDISVTKELWADYRARRKGRES